MGRSRRDAGRSPRACPAARSDRSRDRGRPWMAARSTTRPCCGTSPTTRAHPGHSRDRQVGAWRRGMVAKRLRRRKDGARPRGPSCSSRPGLPTRATSPTPPGRAVEGWITRLKPRATGEAFPHIRSARVDRLAARCSPRGGEHGLCGRKQRGCLKQCATRRTRHQLHRRNRGSPSGQRTLGSADVACRPPYRVIIQREERSVSPRPWTGG